MEVLQAIRRRRSVRAFGQEPIAPEVLAQLVDAARLAPSAANMQPLEYVAVSDPALCQAVFDCLKWAAYTHPIGTPAPGQTPTAYLVVLVRSEYKAGIGAAYDVGAGLTTAILLAQSQGIESCWLKSINAPKLRQILGVPEELEVDSVLALGRGGEECTLVELGEDKVGKEVIRYWRDEAGRQFVPKRALALVLHQNRYGGK